MSCVKGTGNGVEGLWAGSNPIHKVNRMGLEEYEELSNRNHHISSCSVGLEEKASKQASIILEKGIGGDHNLSRSQYTENSLQLRGKWKKIA